MITVLFGAGASYPFYKNHLSTAYLTEQILSPARWTKVIKKYNELIGDKWFPSSDEITQLLFCIKNIYENIQYKEKKDFLNFEQIAEIVDKVSAWYCDFLPDSNLLNLLLTYLNAERKKNQNWHSVPFLFREIIADSIIETDKFGKSDNYDNLQNQQCVFLKYLTSLGEEQISLVSLNYDDSLPTSLEKIGIYDNCFNVSSGINSKELNVKTFMESSKVVYFPHGHLRFTYNEYGNLIGYDEDIKVADKRRWKYIEENEIPHNKGVFSWDYNSFITTGQSKDNAINDVPFSLFYHRLAKDLWTTDKLIVIGYSFGDRHFNRLMQSVMHRKKKCRVFVIDKFSESVKLSASAEGWRNTTFIRKLQNAFFADWIVKVDNEGNVCHNKPEEYRKLNERGWGEVLDGITYYKDGYEQFLNLFEEVIPK